MAGFAQSPLHCLIRKLQIPLILKSVVGDGFYGNGVDQGFKIYPIATDDRTFGLFIGDERHVILIGQILVNAIGHKDVFQAVVVHVHKQGSPAPIGSFNSGQTPYIAKSAIPIVDLQHIAGELMPIAVFQVVAVAIPIVKSGFGF